jgi:hypothetical protein
VEDSFEAFKRKIEKLFCINSSKTKDLFTEVTEK